MDTVFKYGVEYCLSSDKKHYIASGIDKSYSPSELKASLKVLSIAEKINEKPVEKVEVEAFKECEFIEHVNIPKSVKYIGHLAFAKCKNLKKVIWAGNEYMSVEMGHLVFLSCDNLNTVIINSYLKPGTKDFCKCINMTAFICRNIENIPIDFFVGCKKLNEVSFKTCNTLNRGSFIGSGVKRIQFCGDAPSLCDGTIEQWKQDGIEIFCHADNPLAEFSYEGLLVSII